MIVQFVHGKSFTFHFREDIGIPAIILRDDLFKGLSQFLFAGFFC